MRLRFRIFGFTVASILFDPDSQEEPPDPNVIGGGSGHNFERCPKTWEEPTEKGFRFQ